MMNRREFLPAAVLAWGGLFVAKAKLRADEIPKEYQKPIDKGLEWLAKAQQRDGHWEATRRVPSGDGRDERHGVTHGRQHADRRQVLENWLMGVAQRNGVISPLNQLGRGYLHALLFLACLYGEEEEERRHRQLAGILTRPSSSPS